MRVRGQICEPSIYSVFQKGTRKNIAGPLVIRNTKGSYVGRDSCQICQLVLVSIEERL